MAGAMRPAGRPVLVALWVFNGCRTEELAREALNLPDLCGTKKADRQAARKSGLSVCYSLAGMMVLACWAT